MSNTTSTNLSSVRLLCRNIAMGFSIHRVFAPLIPLLQTNCEKFSAHEAPAKTASPVALLRNMWWAFRHHRRGDICHITGDVHYLLFVLPFAHRVVTVHDLITLHLGGSPFWRWLRRKIWLSWSLPLADKIVCISENTRRELLEACNLDSKKVEVIYNPVDPIFQPSFKAFNAEQPRILHIGTNWNKNVDRTIEALKGIPCTLVLVGPLTEEQHMALQHAQIVYENPIGLSDKEMKAQYECCDIVSFPSLFEGFGMPIIEGQAVGRPILTSEIAPLTEVAADTACYVNPQSVESIRQGFLRIIQNESYREELVAKGFENVKRFAASHIASQYLALYHSL